MHTSEAPLFSSQMRNITGVQLYVGVNHKMNTFIACYCDLLFDSQGDWRWNVTHAQSHFSKQYWPMFASLSHCMPTTDKRQGSMPISAMEHEYLWYWLWDTLQGFQIYFKVQHQQSVCSFHCKCIPANTNTFWTTVESVKLEACMATSLAIKHSLTKVYTL